MLFFNSPGASKDLPEDLQNSYKAEVALASQAINNGDLSPLSVFSLFHLACLQVKQYLKGPRSMLLEQSSIDRALSIFTRSSEPKISKKNHSLDFSIIKARNGKKFIIFGGTDNVFASGGMGCIKLCQQLDTGKLCFVKIGGSFNDMERENQALERLGRSLGFLSRTNKNQNLKEYIFIDAIPGLSPCDLIKLLEVNNKSLSRQQQLTLLLSVIQEFKLILSKGIRHNDIKSNNMIITGDMKLQLIDFGACSLDSSTDIDLLQAMDFYKMLTVVRQLITDDQLRDKIKPFSSEAYMSFQELSSLRTRLHEMQPFILELESFLTNEINRLVSTNSSVSSSSAEPISTQSTSAPPITPFRKVIKRKRLEKEEADISHPDLETDNDADPNDAKKYKWGCVCF